MAESAEIATRQEELAQFRTLYNPDLDFARLVSEATHYTDTFTLVEKAQLVGVPFVIISVTYRDGYTTPSGIEGDYVSCEAVIGHEELLKSAPVQAHLSGPLAVYPNQPVVFNDGGTGIRRTLTQLFHATGLIDVGSEAMDRRFDMPMSQWKSGADLARTGITQDATGRPFRYVCPNGLRVSEYESPYGPAVTYYFG